MALGASRILLRGDTPYPWEREAIDFVLTQLPNTDPYHVWELPQILEPSSGRFYEIDLLVLGYSALYLVEIKSGPGRYKGDSLDWYREVPGERTHYMDPPLRLTDHKCKVLKSMLLRQLKDGRDCPRIEPLVFLSHPEVQLELRADGLVGVVTRATIRDALTKHKFFGAPPDWRGQRIEAPRVKALIAAASAAGLRPRKGRDRVGSYVLGDVLEDGPGYQDRLATHEKTTDLRRRARVYLVPQQTSVERRQQLLKAADREASLLHDVRNCPYILTTTDYVPDAPRGPTVLFDDFEHGQPLDAFLRSQPALSFDDRLAIVSQLAHAIAYCHRRRVTHSAVSPSSVLVRRSPEDDKVEVRLFNFQLGGSEKTSGTVHWSQLAADTWAIYQAPELREDPPARSEANDLFGLGAVAYLVFTGEAPGRSSVEVDARLRQDSFLDPRKVTSDLPEAIVYALEMATTHSPVNRSDDAREWFEWLEENLTSPSVPEAPSLSPLEAGAGSTLEGGLRVERVLGHGASSRVLEVTKESDEKRYALKVSLNEEHDERLRAEARTLRKLRHARIVALVDELVIAGRVCLLLELAGERTLHQELTREGPVSLEFAARYGEDLLGALEMLEEQHIVHRDIKPANLGLGALGKSAKHLTLFDFSLTDVPLSELGVGTAAYRDPFLRERKAWDHAADRYGAAVTLHEMLTGVRPSWGRDGTLAHEEGAELVLAAERFDPAAREALTKFFRRALAKGAEQRFGSARDMRHAWDRALEEPRRTPSVHPEATEPSQVEPLGEAALRLLGPGTQVEALPLGTRAKNALDRAGIHRVEQLRSLADNRLSAIRGIGSKVAKEILDFRDAWRAVHGAGGDEAPFYPGYRGEDVAIESAGFDARVAEVLRDGGIQGLSALAAAPSDQLAAIAKREKLSLAPLKARLDAEQKQVDEREHPSTLESWLAALLPTKGKSREYLETLFGLTGPLAGRLDVTVAQVARQFAVTPANLYILVGKQRAAWAQHPAAEELSDMALAVLREQGGATSLSRAAEVLLSRLSHDRSTPAATLLAKAASLLRIATELDKERDAGSLRYVRIHDGEPWLFETEPEPALLAKLGAAADALAERDVLAAPAEAARHLSVVVEGTWLEALAPARLLELACAASEQAACSSRLEIYPRGMANERAVSLTAHVLKGELAPDDVQARVLERYPQAAPVPPRPALDALMAAVGFEWREPVERYVRAGAQLSTTLGTRVPHHSRLATASTGQPRQQTKEALAARDFDQRLRAALQDDSLRVLGVSIDAGAEAARLLGQSVGIEPTSFDDLFMAELTTLTAAGKPSLGLTLRTDGAGPGMPGWDNLKKLADSCAQRALDKLVPATTPLLLHQLGLFARYDMLDALRKLVQGAQARESRAVFLLVPCPDTGGLPRINGTLSIPAILPGQALWVPTEWIENRHNAAA